MFVAVDEFLVDIYLHPDSLSANPERMLKALDQIIDTTLVADLRGFDRWAWRRKIRAAQISSAGLIARDNGLDSELSYMFQSLRAWPSPFWESERFTRFAVSAGNRLRRRNGTP